VVDVNFSVRDDLQVDAHLGPGWPVFNDGLGDSISSLPPGEHLGTVRRPNWIDEAVRGAKESHRSGHARPFLWGNTTMLRVVGDTVVARHDYDEDDDPGESLPLDQFFDLLADWRERAQISASSATEALPETYRRNPTRPRGKWR
jgi:hypothetical protein